MNHLADAVLDYLWFLNFATEEEADPDVTSDRLGELAHQIETQFSHEEQEALQAAATRRLAHWLREPDAHGYTPRALLTDEQRAFLVDIAAGHFNGPDPDDDEVE